MHLRINLREPPKMRNLARELQIERFITNIRRERINVVLLLCGFG